MKLLGSLLLLYFKSTASSPPTLRPSKQPSIRPSNDPSINPSRRPSILPSSKPSKVPSIRPTLRPTAPTAGPSAKPSKGPSIHPTYNPTISFEPTYSMYPTYDPTTSAPSVSIAPTYSFIPSYEPTTVSPTTYKPTRAPVPAPSIKPTSAPATREPSITPTATVTTHLSTAPAAAVTLQPSITPAATVTLQPSFAPTAVVTLQPSIAPTVVVTLQPSIAPTVVVTLQPSTVPTVEVTLQPSTAPAGLVSSQPIVPAAILTLQPSGAVTPHPTTVAITLQPSISTTTNPTLLSPQSIPLITSQPSMAAIMTLQPSAPSTVSGTSTSPVVTTLQPHMMTSTIPSLAPEGFLTAPSLNPTSVPASSALYNFQVTQVASNVSTQAIQSTIGQLALTSAVMQALSNPSAVGLAVTLKSAYSQKMRWRLDGALESDATIVYTASFSFFGSAQSAQYLYLTLSSQLIGSIAQGNFTDYFVQACENYNSLSYTFFDTAPNISALEYAATEIPSNESTVEPSGGVSSSTSALSSEFVGVIVGATIGFLTIAGMITYFFMKRSLSRTKKTTPLPVHSASEALTLTRMQQAPPRAPFMIFTRRQIGVANDEMSEENKESNLAAMSVIRSAVVSPAKVSTESGQETPTQKELFLRVQETLYKESNKDIVTDTIACAEPDDVLRKAEAVEPTDHREKVTSHIAAPATSSGWRPKPYNTVTTGDSLAPLIYGNSGVSSSSGAGFCGFNIMSPIQYEPSRLITPSEQPTYDDTAAVPIGPQSLLATTTAITGSVIAAATTCQISTQAQPAQTVFGGVLANASSPTPIEPGGEAKPLVLEDMETEGLNEGYDPNGSPVDLELKALREQLQSIHEKIRRKSQAMM